MGEQEEEMKQPSLEERLRGVGIEMSIQEPKSTLNDGYIRLIGETGRILQLVEELIDTPAYSQSRKKGIKQELTRIFRRNGAGSIDLLILDDNSRRYMVRLLTQKVDNKMITASFGGGGNLTHFSDMRKVFETSAENFLKKK